MTSRAPGAAVRVGRTVCRVPTRLRFSKTEFVSQTAAPGSTTRTASVTVKNDKYLSLSGNI